MTGGAGINAVSLAQSKCMGGSETALSKGGLRLVGSGQDLWCERWVFTGADSVISDAVALKWHASTVSGASWRGGMHPGGSVTQLGACSFVLGL